MGIVYLLLGTNLGNKNENLVSAKERIIKSGQPIVKESTIYETAPWGFQHPESFYNQAVAIQTDQQPNNLLSLLLKIEMAMGRSRKIKGYEARIIDIDILLYEDWIIQTDFITIPHPMMHLRRFTLEPLCEIAPLVIHPVLNLNIQKLLHECIDKSYVKSLD